MKNAPQIQTPQAKIRKEHSHPLFLSHLRNIHKIVRDRGLKCPANSMHVSISALLLIQAFASATQISAGLPASHLLHLYSVLHEADKEIFLEMQIGPCYWVGNFLWLSTHFKLNLSCVQASLKSWLARLLGPTWSHTFSGSLLLNLARLPLFCYWRVIIIIIFGQSSSAVSYLVLLSSTETHRTGTYIWPFGSKAEFGEPFFSY